MQHCCNYGQRTRERLVWVVLALLSGGCGEAGVEVERSVTFGEVRYKGQAVANGTIRFIAEDGPTTQTSIRDGRYRVEAPGVPIGPNRVEIESMVEDGPEVPLAPGKTVKQARQVLPEKYNAKTELSVDILAESENEQNFDLAE